MVALVHPDCQRCPLAYTRMNVVQPELPDTLRILFVGRDPGAIEDVQGTPFHHTAQAGSLLRRLLREVGIPLEWCGFDNTVRCHTPKNRGPRRDEVQACKVWTHVIHRTIHPEVIVLLGQEALEGWTNSDDYRPSRPRYALGEWHGRRLPGDHTVIPMYHPSACLRSNEYRRMLVGDLKALAAMLGVHQKVPNIIRGNLEYLAPQAPIAVDTESSTTGTLLGIGIAVREGDHLLGDWFSGDRLGVGMAVLRRRHGPIIMHNAKYDWQVLADAGVILVPSLLEDTMLMAHVLRRNQEVGSLGLKELTLADLGLSWTTLTELGNPEDLPDEVLGEYCLYDAASTLLLWEEYQRRLAGTRP